MTQHHKDLTDFLTQTGTTQQDFASKLGISRAHLSRLVSGERTASLPLALRIASAASIPVEALLPPQRERRHDPDRRSLADRRCDACAHIESKTAEEGV